MTIREMDIFVNVAKLLKLTKVSEKMNLTQPSISMAIKSIEEEFNEKLFDRISKKLIINERGRALYEEVTPILLQLKGFEERFIQNKFSGNINVAASNTIGAYVLADVLYDYKKLYKDINITHLYPEPNHIISLINEGKVDIGFIEFELFDKDIVKELLYKDELIVVSSDKSLIEKSFYIDQLFDKEWIVREISSAVTQTFFDYLGDVKSDLNITLALEHTVSIKELLIKHKNAISILPAKSVETEIRSNKLYKIDIINMKFERNTYMIYHKNKFKNIIFESFRKFAFENIAK